MKKFLFATIFTVCLPLLLFAQAPDTLWTRTFGGDDQELGSYVAATSDNCFIMIGTTWSYGAGERDAYLIKTDENGDTLWTHTYGGNDNDGVGCVEELNDGNFIFIVGSANGCYTDFCLRKLT